VRGLRRGAGRGDQPAEDEVDDTVDEDTVDEDTVDEADAEPVPAAPRKTSGPGLAAAKPARSGAASASRSKAARSTRPEPAAAPPAKQHRIFWKLYHGETSIDFIGKRWRGFILSMILIAVGIGGLATRGLNLGIDFKGGTSWELDAHGATVAKARDALRPLGLGAATIQVLGSGKGQRLRVESKINNTTAAKSTQVRDALAKVAGDSDPSAAVTVNSVGPTWGKEITKKAIRAIIIFFAVVFLYITVRFEKWMAAAALVEVVHDVIITVGIYAVVGFQVTPDTVVAFLTILGYSLYDTIVVFDKIEENAKGMGSTGRYTYTDVVNLSMNQTLMRSMNTTIVAVLPVVSVLVIGAYGLGAATLEDFGLALMIGLLSGAYSSLFIGAPLLAMVKERESRWRGVRLRIEAKGGGATSGLLTPAAAAAGGITGTREKRGAKVVARSGAGGRRRTVSVVDEDEVPEDDFDQYPDDVDDDQREATVVVPRGTKATKAGVGAGAGAGGAGKARTTPAKAAGAPAAAGGGKPAAGRPAGGARTPPRPRTGGKANAPRPRKKGKRR
jgi:preprotein translocase subunit SecF